MTFPAEPSRRFNGVRGALIAGVMCVVAMISESNGNDLRITGIVPRGGSNLMICWDGGRGLGQYQVQTSTDGRAWHDYHGPVEGVMNRTVASDGKMRFFRMRLVPDTVAPTTPQNLVASPTSSAVALSWQGSTDAGGAGLWGYALMRNGAMQEFLQGSLSQFTDSTVTPGQTYTYSLHSVDAAGNWSAESAGALALVPTPPDRTAPSVPSGLAASTPTCTQVRLTWNQASDRGGSGVQGYRVYFGTNFVQQVGHPTTTFTHSGRTPMRPHVYSVAAFDFAGNESARSPLIAILTPACPDTTLPKVTLLSPADGGTVSRPFPLSASASDDMGVVRVEFYRDAGVHLHTATGPNYNTTLDPRTLPSGLRAFYAKAFDSASNVTISATNFVVVTDIAASVPAPKLAGIVPGIGLANGVTVADNFAYIASSGWGLSIADLRDENRPGVISSVDTPFDGRAVSVSGDLVGVIGERLFFSGPGEKTFVYGLYVVDVSDRTAPVLRGSIENSQEPWLAVALRGQYAYLAGGGDGITVVDLGKPATPEVLRNYDTPGWASSVAVQDNYLFVADGQQGLRILDISNPASPAPLRPGNSSAGSIRLNENENVIDVTVSGNFAYLVTIDSLQVIDISNKLSPVRRSRFPLSSPHTALRVRVNNNVAYLATSAGGMLVIDVSNPLAPASRSEVSPSGALGAITTGIAVSGARAYMANGQGGLAVVNVDNASSPALVTTLRHRFKGHHISARPGLAVVTGEEFWEGSGGLTNSVTIFDLQTAEHPRLIGRLDDPERSYLGVSVVGNYAFVARGLTGVTVIDLTNPRAPVRLGTYDTPGWATDVAVQGGYVFVADGMFGLRIFRITNSTSLAMLDPNDPSVGAVSVGDNLFDVFVSGNYAYLCAGRSFHIIDIADKRRPVARAALTLGSSFTALRAVADTNYAYVAASEGGLAVVDVRNPSSPVVVGSLAPSGSLGAMTTDVVVSGARALLSNGLGGIAVADISNPATPRLLQSAVTLESASGLVLAGNWLCVSDTIGTLNVFRVEP